MRLADRINREIDNLDRPILQPGAAVELARLVNAQARLADAFQRGVLTLARKRTGNRQTVTVVHQHVSVAGGQVAVAGHVTGPSTGPQREGGQT
jgi:hypothetical protein